MACLISTLLFLLVLMIRLRTAVSDPVSDPSEPMCYDWGESREMAVSVLEGEVGWLSCPLFSHPSVYNYTSTQSAGHNLVWYRLPEGHDLEQPITSSSRLTKDRERLWLQPAAAADTGLYICMLRNKSSCSRIAMRLKVLRPDEVVRVTDCEPPAAVAASKLIIPLQEGRVLYCPDLQDAAKMADSEPNVIWHHVKPDKRRCYQYPFWKNDRKQIGASLHVHLMQDPYQGLYYCIVHYQRRGSALNFTRRINVTAVYPSTLPKLPSIINPARDQVFTVRQNTEVRLVCRGLFPFLDTKWEIWWTVDGKTLDKLPDHHRFSKINKLEKPIYGDQIEESVLVIKDFQSGDLDKEFNCSIRNEKGFDTRQAQLKEEGERNESPPFTTANI